MKPTPQDPEHVPATPTACPFCRSSKITTASEKADAQAYWRCEACGEMWNLDRLNTASRKYTDGSRWR
jgi:transposase-like protein